MISSSESCLVLYITNSKKKNQRNKHATENSEKISIKKPPLSLSPKNISKTSIKQMGKKCYFYSINNRHQLSKKSLYAFI